jgi:subfamily B ATP-binding cassette protein MsbA
MPEFFDKDYTAKEAYGRLYRYARKYRMRLLIGLLAGSITAGSWVPIFQVIQPILRQVQTIDNHGSGHHKEDVAQSVAEPAGTPPGSADARMQESAVGKKSSLRRGGLPAWFGKVEGYANRMGITFRDEHGHMTGELLLITFLIVPLVMLVKMVTMYLNNYCLRWAGTKVVQDFRVDLFSHLQNQSLQFFARTDVGQLMSRCTTDPQHIEHVISHTVADLCRAPFEILVAVGYVIYFAVHNNMIETLVLVLIGFPLLLLPMTFLGVMVRKWSRRVLRRISLISSKMHENLTGIRVVKAYHTEEYEIEKYKAANRFYVKSVLRAIRLELLITPAVECVGISLIFVFVVYCFFRKIELQDITPLLVPFFVAYRPMKQLGKVQAQIERGRAALARIFSLLDTDMSLPVAANPVRKESFEESVRFENVSYTYGDGAEFAVKDVSFEIPCGSVVAVVGGTGAGKTTLAALLARFCDPTSGSVTMDGTELDQIDIADLRNLIGVVTQETVLFNDTVANNIAYGSPDATREQVIEAAKMANAHDFIVAHPEGYDRVVGEKGFALSGGERQRVAIARAILKNPPILVLDEATSALDTVTERLVQDAINKLMANRTTFAIAHRLSTIRNACMILVMEKGRIVERGTHEQLYEAGGAYRRLCDMQMMA